MPDGGTTDVKRSLDSGVAAFVLLLRFLERPADAAQLRHQFAPDGETFTATPKVEAQVLNEDIGFIFPGQKVSVKLDAFPFTRYGTIAGEVVDISRDANKYRHEAGRER